MPLEKFRTFEEARRALWLPSGDARIFERLARLGALARVPPRPRGVMRFRTQAEAKAHKFVGRS